MVEIQRFTKIILNDQIITILTEDEPTIIQALQRENVFTKLKPPELSTELSTGTIIRSGSSQK